LICFAVDSRESFKDVSEIWSPLVDEVQPTAKKLLVATKVDLRASAAAPGSKKPLDIITVEEGQSLAASINAAYCEWSLHDHATWHALFQRVERLLTNDARDSAESTKKTCEML
jgi:GTPase SAR1 family protein